MHWHVSARSGTWRLGPAGARFGREVQLEGDSRPHAPGADRTIGANTVIDGLQ